MLNIHARQRSALQEMILEDTPTHYTTQLNLGGRVCGRGMYFMNETGTVMGYHSEAYNIDDQNQLSLVLEYAALPGMAEIRTEVLYYAQPHGQRHIEKKYIGHDHVEREFYPNGVLKSCKNYKNDRRVGVEEYFTENGNACRRIYRDDRGLQYAQIAFGDNDLEITHDDLDGDAMLGNFLDDVMMMTEALKAEYGVSDNAPAPKPL